MDTGRHIRVQKYGGSSLTSVDSVRRVAGLVAGAYRAGRPVVVVVSARGDTTDELLDLARTLSAVRPGREVDQLLATGETASAAQLALALHGHGVPAVSLTAAQAGIYATGSPGAGVISRIDPTGLHDRLDLGQVPVVAGFQAVDPAGDVVTLGRGGSDTTAVALAAELGAGQCEIYTDVDGIYTADPRIVPGARLLPIVPAPVMAEMSFAGARVMYSRAVELAALGGVELQVHSSLTGRSGTTIRSALADPLESRGAVMAITHDPAAARVLIQAPADLAREVFEVLARFAAPVDLVARSGSHEPEFRMGFTVHSGHVERLTGPLRAITAPLGGRVEVSDDVGKLSLVGTGLLNRPELVSRMLGVLDRAGIPTSWVAATQLRTSVTVPRPAVARAVALLHDEFALDRTDFDVAPLVGANEPGGAR